jgi:hypothetical protein
MPNYKIKAGDFVCTAEQYEMASKILTFLMEFKPIIENVGGRTDHYYTALAYCFRDEKVDKQRLLKKVKQFQANLIPVITIHQAFDKIEEAYNNRSKDKVYIKTRYRQYLDDRYKWYNSKYGNKY